MVKFFEIFFLVFFTEEPADDPAGHEGGARGGEAHLQEHRGVHRHLLLPHPGPRHPIQAGGGVSLASLVGSYMRSNRVVIRAS
jgi:hypothetical protein